MKRDRFTLHPWPWRAWVALLLATLLAACGGGGSGGGVDTGGTGAPVASYANGRIAGFGSIVVNEVHYDESGAAIVDDGGQPVRPGDLKLGMTVEVEAGPIERDALTQVERSTASRIAVASEIKGAVESVDAGASTLRVLGQTVRVDLNTVIDGFASLAAVRTGDIVEVFAFFDPTTGTYTATRLEREAAPAAFKLRGPIASLDTTARTFAIGGAAIGYADVPAAELPGLADGVLARVEVRPATQGGRWIATRIDTPLPAIPEAAVTKIEGFITEFAGPARFRVDGAIVDASDPDVVFERGSLAQLANGARIEVEGRTQAGVLVAERIKVRRSRDAGNGDAQEDRQEFEVTGAIESVNAAARTFVIRDITVTFGTDTRFDRGEADDLRAGVEVEVRGTLAGGNRLQAERIRFER